MSNVNIPDFVLEKIRLLAQKLGRSEDELIQQYLQIYNDPWLQSDPQFKTDEERHAYAVRVLWVRAVAKPPSKEYVVIPFGYTEERITKTSGVPMSRIYALVKTDQGFEKAIIVCKGAQAGLWQDVMLFHAYKVKLFYAKGVYLATSDTKFENPQPIPMDPIQFLTRHVGVKVFKLAEVHRNISRREGNFVDEFDIKGIYGIVLRYSKGTRPDGTKWGFYVISDDSVGAEDQLDEEGRVIPSELTVWIAPSMIKYAEESELFLYGTVQLSNDGIPFMNAIGVVPVHAKPIPMT